VKPSILVRPRRKVLGWLVLGCIILLVCVFVLGVMLGPTIGERFFSPAGRQYCIEFFDDTNHNGVQDKSEQTIVIPGALVNELHGREVYATYAADRCAPMVYVDFDVEVILPLDYEATTPERQNIGGRYDDAAYVFRFGVRKRP
jgi:hypothetical protein